MLETISENGRLLLSACAAGCLGLFRAPDLGGYGGAL